MVLILKGSLGKWFGCVLSGSRGRLAKQGTGRLDVFSEGRVRESSGGTQAQTARVRGESREKRRQGGKRRGVSEKEGVSQHKALTGLNTVLGQQIIGA